MVKTSKPRCFSVTGRSWDYPTGCTTSATWSYIATSPPSCTNRPSSTSCPISPSTPPPFAPITTPSTDADTATEPTTCSSATTSLRTALTSAARTSICGPTSASPSPSSGGCWRSTSSYTWCRSLHSSNPNLGTDWLFPFPILAFTLFPGEHVARLSIAGVDVVTNVSLTLSYGALIRSPVVIW